MRLASYVRGIGISMAVTALILHFSDSRVSATAMSDEEIKARAAQLGMIESVMLSELDKNENGSDNEEGVALPNVGESGLPDPAGLHDEDGTIAAGEDIATLPPTRPAVATATASPTEKTEATPTPVPTNTPAPTKAPTHTPTPAPTNTPTPTVAPTNTPTPTPSTPPTNTPTPTPKADEGGTQVGLNTEQKEITVVAGDGSYTVARRLAEAGIVPSAAEYDEFLCKNGYDRKITTGKHVIPAGSSFTRIAEILTGK